MPKIKGNGKASLWIDEDLSTFLSLDMIASHPERNILIRLLQFTGERIGAVLQLQVEDCYENSGKPRQQILFRKHTRKGKDSSREVPCSHKLADCLKAFSPPKAGYLFQSPSNPNKPMSYGNCHRWFVLALEKAALKSKGYSWHSFRRTFTTKLAKKLPISELQKLTGHKSLDVLRGYIEVDEQAIAKALESL